jgi:hypothetical protein
MPDIFFHELASYKHDIEARQRTLDSKPWSEDRSMNLTHFSLAVSNRANLMVVGLASLVDARLLGVAEEAEKSSPFKLSDMTGNGLGRLKLFLSRLGVIDFETFASWASFRHLHTIRNVIVHGYGGLVAPSDTDKLNTAITALGVQHVLFGHRIRFDTPALMVAHSVASATIAEIEQKTR